ncbi:hypothetical protein BDB01DRAFT_837963 [Pilobolus umbonatus]|nr:hypothetical protein BDB01DRAFT_837963 [Pilobolus umbonatus]
MKLLSFQSLFVKSKSDPSMKDNRHARVSEEELHSLKQAFTLYDVSHQGGIDLEAFIHILKSLHFKTDEETTRYIVNEVDRNQDGKIDFDEFVEAMTFLFSDENEDTRLRRCDSYPANTITNTVSYNRHYEVDELRDCFSRFDKNGDGFISKQELKDVMVSLGENLSQDEIDDMMNEADINRDGYIDYEEFKRLLPIN